MLERGENCSPPGLIVAKQFELNLVVAVKCAKCLNVHLPAVNTTSIPTDPALQTDSNPSVLLTNPVVSSAGLLQRQQLEVALIPEGPFFETLKKLKAGFDAVIEGAIVSGTADPMEMLKGKKVNIAHAASESVYASFASSPRESPPGSPPRPTGSQNAHDLLNGAALRMAAAAAANCKPPPAKKSRTKK